MHGRVAARLHLAHEVGAVFRLAHRRRRQQIEARGAHHLGEPGKARDARQRHLHAVGVQSSGLIEIAAQAAEHFFVEYGGGHAPRAVEDDEAHGVGADIDDRHRLVGLGDAAAFRRIDNLLPADRALGDTQRAGGARFSRHPALIR